jgi:hypothetical protein
MKRGEDRIFHMHEMGLMVIAHDLAVHDARAPYRLAARHGAASGV